MRKGGGKSKGSAFEREYAKKISLFLTNGKNPDTVWRSSNSGGKASVTNSKIQCGDLISVSQESKKFFDIFSLELKNYKSLDLLDFQKDTFLLKKWWEQAKNDAKRANKIPILIIRINRKGDWIVWEMDFASKINDYFNPLLQCGKINCNFIEISSGNNTLYFHPIDYFFNRLDINRVT